MGKRELSQEQQQPPRPSPQGQSSSSSGDSSPTLKAFKYGLPSAESKRRYPAMLRPFFKSIGLSGSIGEQCEAFMQKLREFNDKDNAAKWAQESIAHFIYSKVDPDNKKDEEEEEEKPLTVGTIKNYFFAIKLFIEMNDEDLHRAINWKKISRVFVKRRRFANDRAPTVEEIRKLVDFPDRRIKALVYTMCSGGIRLGAWQYLRRKHVTPIHNKKGELVAAKLIVYAGEPEEYFTFITPEAYNAVSSWMDFRATYGEKISGESWLMRDMWQTSNVTHGAKCALATNPKKLQQAGIIKILNRALFTQDLRRPLRKGERRHEWKISHGFRKYFETRALQVMKLPNVELLQGHEIGITSSYYRPTENELLEDYVKGVPLLTINDIDKSTLQAQVAELTEARDKAERAKSELDEVKSKTLKLEESVLLLSNLMRQNLRGVRSEDAEYALDTASEMMERTEEEQWEREAREKERSEL